MKRAMLGITVATTDTTVRLDEEGRLVIEEELTVAEAPTAGTAGYGLLKQNDILKSATIDGVTTELGRRFYLIDLLLQVRKGDTISLTIERGGEEMQVEVVFDKDGYFTTYA